MKDQLGTQAVRTASYILLGDVWLGTDSEPFHHWIAHTLLPQHSLEKDKL